MPRLRLQFAAVALMTLGPLFGLAGVPVRSLAQDDIRREYGVAFGDVNGTPLLLDLYRPLPGDVPRPGVLVLSPSGRSNVAYAAVPLVQAGYVAIAMDYPLRREPWPAQLDVAQRAVRWVRANAAALGLDPDRLCAYGHYGSGRLAAMLGVRETRLNDDPALASYSSRVDCVIDLAGDNDLTIPYPYRSDTEAVIQWLGGTLAEVPERYRDASPVFHVDAETAPFLVMHGTADSIIPVEHSRRLVAALLEAGVGVVYVELQQGIHGDMEVWTVIGPWILTFLESQ